MSFNHNLVALQELVSNTTSLLSTLGESVSKCTGHAQELYALREIGGSAICNHPLIKDIRDISFKITGGLKEVAVAMRQVINDVPHEIEVACLRDLLDGDDDDYDNGWLTNSYFCPYTSDLLFMDMSLELGWDFEQYETSVDSAVWAWDTFVNKVKRVEGVNLKNMF